QGGQVSQSRDVLEALLGELRRRYVLRLVAAGSDRLLRDEPFHLLRRWWRRLQLFAAPTQGAAPAEVAAGGTAATADAQPATPRPPRAPKPRLRRRRIRPSRQSCPSPVRSRRCGRSGRRSSARAGPSAPSPPPGRRPSRPSGTAAASADRSASPATSGPRR